MRSSIFLAYAIALAACDSGGTEPSGPAVAALRLDFGPNSKGAVVAPGSTVSISTTVVAEDGSVVPPPAKINFLSRDPSVVQVDDSGRATVLALGAAFVVGTLNVAGRTYQDSVRIAGATISNLSDTSP